MQTHDRLKSMEHTVEALKKHPGKEYTLVEIKAMCLIPWARDDRTVRKIISADLRGANLLRAKIYGIGTQRRYIVPKGGLIKYLQTYGPALMATVRKPKHHHD